jgi:hemoglobin-like flavoprotein
LIPTHATLVRESWASLAPGREAAVSRFRARLEAVSPRTAARFTCLDHEAQRDGLLVELDQAIAATGSDDELVPALARIARRFREGGPASSEYPAVRDALLEVLAEGDRGIAPPELRRAWGSLFGLLAALVDRAGRVAPGNGEQGTRNGAASHPASQPATQPSSHPEGAQP